MKSQKVVVAVDMDEAALKSLKQFQNLPINPESEIHLVHVFELSFKSFDFLPSVQPSPEDCALIQEVIEEKLTKVKADLGLEQHKNVITKCIIASNARQEFLNYADKVGATLIVAAAKEKHGFQGLFESSFTSFLNKFSRANLLTLRPER